MQGRKADAAGRPGWRIVIAGTGGQGVITAARLLTAFFVQRGQEVVSSQLHGMAQRGGAVHAAVMIDGGISPAMPAASASCVIGFEPLETVRALPYISRQTTVLMNSTPVVPYVLAQELVRGEGSGVYPELTSLEEQLRKATGRLQIFDATALARRTGAVRTLNVVMLGCLFGSGLLPAEPQEFIDTVLKTAPPKLADVNRRAFLYGAEFGNDLPCLENA